MPIVYIVISLFVSVLFHFMLILLKLKTEKCTRSYAEAEKLTDYSTASCIQLSHSFSVNHYFSFRIKQELPIVYIVISLFVSVLFHFTLILLKLKNEKCTRSYAEAEKTHGLFHSILYPTESFIFCKSLLFFQNKARIADSLYSYKFICVCIISFYANITKIEKRKVYSFLC